MYKIGIGIVAALAAGALGHTGSVQAQSLTQNIIVTDPVTVTATTNPLAAFEYPGSVTVIGAEEIETKIPSTVDDILEDVPNVTFAGGPRRTGEVPIIRGFSGQDVIVLLDGTRQNFISGHDGRFYLDPALIDQVEVVRGATSALYGSGGLGGVIEFRTKDAADFLEPGETFGTSVFLGYQSANDEFNPGITLFATPMEGVDLIGSFVYRSGGDIRLGGGDELDADDDIISGLFKASYQVGASNIEFGWTRYDASALEPNNGQGLEGPDNENVDKDLMAETFRLTYEYSDPDNDWVDLNAQVYYTRYRADEQRLVTTGLGPAGELLTRDLNTIGFRIDNRSRFAIGDDTNVVLTYGAEAYRDKQDGQAGDADREGVPDAQSTFYGFFAQAEISTPAPFGLPGDFLIIPGIRYDNYSSSSDIAEDNHDQAVSPKIGVSYLPTDWMMAYASYAHAFSAPNLNDLYATGVHFQIPGFLTNFFVPNPDLKPQTTRTFEAGLGFDFDNIFWLDDRFTAKGGYFRTWAKDLISFDVFQPFPPACVPFPPPGCDGTTTVSNISDAVLDGIEATAAYENEFFLIEVSYGHINGIDRETGDRIGSLQPDQLALHVAGKLPQIDAVVGWRVIGAGDFADLESTTDTDESRDAYIVQDVYAIWQPDDGLLNGLSVAVGIDNVTDEEYTRVFTGANEVGRNFKALVSYTIAW